MLQVTGGILTGATGVNVGGTLYNVSFQDGTCAELFSGCDSGADFLFNQVTGNLAAQAFLDQVFLDGPDGPFDSAPQMTRGCLGTTNECTALFPVSIQDIFDTPRFAGYGAVNYPPHPIFPDVVVFYPPGPILPRFC
jgi:hypothetical protein